MALLTPLVLVLFVPVELALAAIGARSKSGPFCSAPKGLNIALAVEVVDPFAG